MLYFKRTRLLLLLGWLLSGAALAQSAPSLRQQLQHHFDGKAYPGILIGYAGPGSAFTAAFGLADTATQQPLRPDQLMMSGSTGKIVVAAAALKLVQENKLELDAPISRYLQGAWADVIPNYTCLTVRQLLQHRTGLARYIFTDFKEDVRQNPDKVWQPLEQVRYVSDIAPKFMCGEDFAYSDTNYLILGAIIEKVSGKSFYSYADVTILRPLKLRSFTPTNKRVIAGLANGYAVAQDPLGFTGPALDAKGKSRYNMQFEWAGGGYAYNPQDMAKLLCAIFEGKVFGKALLQEFPATLPAPEVQAAYGLGIMKYNLSGKELYGHSGFFPGYITQAYYDPESKEAFVFQINTTAPNGTKDLNSAVKAFFGERQ